MIDHEKLRTVIVLVAGGVGLWFAYYHMYVPSVISWFREGVFAERHELFMLVAEGKIEPTHPAYTSTRSLCNGLIRFADRIELARVLLIAAVVRDRHYTPVGEYIETVEDPDVRAELNRVCTVVSRRAAILTFVRSPALLALAGLSVLLLAVFAIALALLKKLSRATIGVAPSFDAYSRRYASIVVTEQKAIEGDICVA